MSDFKIIHAQLGAVPVSSTGTVQQLPLGYVAQAQDLQSGSGAMGCGRFVYVVGVASNASSPIRGDLCLIKGNTVQKAGMASSGSYFPVGIAAGSISGTNVYGWVQVRGLCDYANMENATTDSYNGGVVAATAFIGSATDGCMNTTQSAAGAAIIGIGFPMGSIAISGSRSVWSTASFNGMTVQLNFPQLRGGSASAGGG
jgi:hypothetical protein